MARTRRKPRLGPLRNPWKAKHGVTTLDLSAARQGGDKEDKGTGRPTKGEEGWGTVFSFGGTVQCIEESNIYLCFVVCRLKRGLVT